MIVIDGNHVIQAFATNASDDTFHVTVLPRTPRCDPNVLDAHSFNSRPEGFTVYSVAVSHNVPWSAVFGKRLDDLLCGPTRRRMLGDVVVNNAPTVVR